MSKYDLEDNPWFIGGLIGLVVLVLGISGYFMHKADVRSEERQTAYKKELESRPIKDLRNGFIQVDEMYCRQALKGYSKRQLSKLTEDDKWYGGHGSQECGITFEGVRLRKDRIRAYSPHFSVFFWRDDKDANDIDAPVHIKEFNIENCEVSVGPTRGKFHWVVVHGKCEFMDKAL